ncbi:hypothetical protein MKZ38_003221 [Zalerion maritima]|uniref:Pyridoxamine 5'-phosphate oxidase Alr4036 family FMN-binding domain-containing protein n=1 Tax=Zalerion maritima TaxID=339359 RepID=A0AAD5WXR2_9PEZI|nr:hypothetical protein MKZ38_003221 [Zalerion maritima]
MASKSISPAPWRKQFLRDISKLPMATCSFATLHPTSLSHASEPAGTSFDKVPRVRTIVFRGMWATIPPNERNPAPKNSPDYESDMPSFTTDVRTEKIAELTGTGDGAVARTSSSTMGSGGGGPVEAVFWVPDTMTQWRLRGTAYIIAPDIETEKGCFAREVLEKKMRPKGSSDGCSWSWTRELTAHFGNMSPKMRGSFRNPLPGAPRDNEPKDPRLGLGQEVSDLEDEIARENFRVVVIVPGEVDQVDLEGQRRWIHRCVESGEEEKWETCEVWP